MRLLGSFLSIVSRKYRMPKKFWGHQREKSKAHHRMMNLVIKVPIHPFDKVGT